MSSSRIEGRLSKLSLADKPQIDSKKHKRCGSKISKSKSSSAGPSSGSKIRMSKHSADGPSHGDKAVEPKIATAPGQGDKGEGSKLEAVLALLESDLAGEEPHTVTVFDTLYTGGIPEDRLNAPRVSWRKRQNYVPFDVFSAQEIDVMKLRPRASCGAV